MIFRCLLLVFGAMCARVIATEGDYSFDNAQVCLKKYCESCHQPKAAVGGFSLQRVSTPESFRTEAQKWTSLKARVTNGEMPPKGAPAPVLEEREKFTQWIDKSLRAEACAAGVL